MISEMEDAMNARALRLTKHAATRLAQRGFRHGDAELIMTIGTEVEGGYLVRRKDAPDKQMRRLIGRRLVIAGDTIVTGYYSRPGEERKLLKNH